MKAMVDLWIGSRHIVGRTLSEENPARESSQNRISEIIKDERKNKRKDIKYKIKDIKYKVESSEGRPRIAVVK